MLSDDLNGIVAALDALSIPTLLLGAPDTLEESYEQLETLGAATGHADDAAKAVAGRAGPDRRGGGVGGRRARA